MELHKSFSALGDETRLAIVERLLSEGAQTAGDLGDIAPVSAPALSRHLKVLREAGLVSVTPDAQRRIYSANPEAFRKIVGWTISHREFWASSLDRLETLIEEEDI